MTALPLAKDPIDIPVGGWIKRPEPEDPFVAMSNRKRWGNCALSAVLPQLKTPSGPAAEEGTEAHKVAEWALHRTFQSANVGAEPPVVLPPQGLEGFDYSAQGVADWQALTLQYAKTYATEAAGLFSDLSSPTFCMVECKIDDVVIHGVKVFTVSDVLLWNGQAKRLVSGDYKFGRSPVGVGTVDEPNEQTAGAAVLWARQSPAHLQPQQIGLFVYQPRTLYGEPWQPLAPLGPDWLAKEAAKLDSELAAVGAAAAAMARGELVDPTPGEHCKYCPSARWCPAAAGYGTVALQVEAGTRAVVDLSPEEVMQLWASRKAFDAFTDDLKERVKILHEQKHPSVTIKRRMGNRVWLNDAMVVEALFLADRADLLKPPGLQVAEAVLPKGAIDTLTTRAPDVLTYVATADKNTAAASAAFAKYLPKENS